MIENDMDKTRHLIRDKGLLGQPDNKNMCTDRSAAQTMATLLQLARDGTISNDRTRDEFGKQGDVEPATSTARLFAGKRPR